MAFLVAWLATVVRGGTLIYNSYGEWLDSPYSDPKTGKTCQECHMPMSDREYLSFPRKAAWSVIISHSTTIHARRSRRRTVAKFRDDEEQGRSDWGISLQLEVQHHQ